MYLTVVHIDCTECVESRYETEKMMAMACGLQVCDEIDFEGFVQMMNNTRHSGFVAEKIKAVADSIAEFQMLFECFDVEMSFTSCSLDFAINESQLFQVSGSMITPSELLSDDV